MAAGAWDRTAAILEFIALSGGVKNVDRQKLNPYRNLDSKRGAWAGVFAAGRAMLDAKKPKTPMNEKPDGSG